MIRVHAFPPNQTEHTYKFAVLKLSAQTPVRLATFALAVQQILQNVIFVGTRARQPTRLRKNGPPIIARRESTLASGHPLAAKLPDRKTIRPDSWVSSGRRWRWDHHSIGGGAEHQLGRHGYPPPAQNG